MIRLIDVIDSLASFSIELKVHVRSAGHGGPVGREGGLAFPTRRHQRRMGVDHHRSDGQDRPIGLSTARRLYTSSGPASHQNGRPRRSHLRRSLHRRPPTQSIPL